jgi:hypothetical protein
VDEKGAVNPDGQLMALRDWTLSQTSRQLQLDRNSKQKSFTYQNSGQELEGLARKLTNNSSALQTT